MQGDGSLYIPSTKDSILEPRLVRLAYHFLKVVAQSFARGLITGFAESVNGRVKVHT